MFCEHCGKEIKEGMRFCENCGSPIANAQGTETPSQTQTVAQPMASTSNNYVASTTTAKKSNTGLIVGVVLAFIAIVVIVGIFVFGKLIGNPKKTSIYGTYESAYVGTLVLNSDKTFSWEIGGERDTGVYTLEDNELALTVDGLDLDFLYVQKEGLLILYNNPNVDSWASLLGAYDNFGIVFYKLDKNGKQITTDTLKTAKALDGMYESEEGIVYTFHKDGSFNESDNFLSDHSLYFVEGDEITLISLGIAEKYKYTLQDSCLTLFDYNGESIEYYEVYDKTNGQLQITEQYTYPSGNTYEKDITHSGDGCYYVLSTMFGTDNLKNIIAYYGEATVGDVKCCCFKWLQKGHEGDLIMVSQDEPYTVWCGKENDIATVIWEDGDGTISGENGALENNGDPVFPVENSNDFNGYHVDSNVNQIIYVQCNGSTASLSLCGKDEENEWDELIFCCDAYIGSNGTTPYKVEGDRCTPAGVFNILYYISTQKADSRLKYVQIENGDVWICNPNSKYYNTLKPSNLVAGSDLDGCEDMYTKFTNGSSVACIVFDYNGDGKTAGSAYTDGGSDIFIDGVGTRGNLTSGYGDIKIAGDDMISLLECLDSRSNPILIVE